MVREDSDDDGPNEPYVAGLDELWLRWAGERAGVTGRALRRALFASFTSALQERWPDGGYRFRFAEAPRRPRSTTADDTDQARALLGAMFPGLRCDARAFTWRDPIDALDDFLDRWLFFREHRPYVRRDDVPDWMMPALREPWAACVADVIEGDAEARAAALDDRLPTERWGDHGVALVIAAGPRLCTFHVGLWTD